MQPSQENVTSFTISYSFSVTGCPGVSGSDTETVTLAQSAVVGGGSTHQFTVSGLQENSVYMFMVSATNSVGTSPEAPLSQNTLIAGNTLL